MADRLQAEVIERGRVAAELRAHEEQLRLALQAGRMGTWDWDLVTGKARLDPAESALLGLPTVNGEIDVDDFFDLVLEEDRAGLMTAVEAAIRQHQPYDHEFRITTPGRVPRWLAGRGAVLRDADGQPLRLIGVNFDITARKRDEENLRLRTRAIEFATNGILIADARRADLPVIFVNPAFTTLTGYSAEETLGRNCRFLQGPQTDPETVAVVRDAIRNHKECAVTILNYRRDGTPFWNDLQIAPIVNDDGEVTHYIGIQTDVTERVDAEWELWQARNAAEAANRAKSRFLASMSHEIRTPLTAVLGCADVLRRQAADDDSRELANVIRNQGQLLMGLLNDLLDLSKIESGRLDLHPESCSVASLIDEVRSLMQPLAAEKGLELATDVDPSTPDGAWLDPLRFRQVLFNLVSNAIKFTAAGRVAVRASSEGANGARQLVIAVSDTGVGIPEDRLQQIFQEFYQVQDSAAQRGMGTGLGLTIVRNLVKLQGGSITVTSEPGRGSTFTIWLPVTVDGAGPSLEGEQEAAAERIETATHVVSTILPCRVLIVEDTRGLQFMLQKMLTEFVSQTVTAANGVEAIQAVRDAEASGARFHAVLMDMQMPVMDGFEATRQVRSLGFAGPIIALTAAAMAGEREKCLEAGCTDYLTKPVDRDRLWRTLRRHYTC
jgi:PAS domain S-box-containing protein